METMVKLVLGKGMEPPMYGLEKSSAGAPDLRQWAFAFWEEGKNLNMATVNHRKEGPELG